MAWYQDLNAFLWFLMVLIYIWSAKTRRLIPMVFFMLISLAAVLGGWLDTWLTLEGKIMALVLLTFVPLAFWVRD